MPPTSNHLSTAECIAWVLSAIERKPHIYEVLMGPLDLMVEKWRSFSDNIESSRKKPSNSEVEITKRKQKKEKM